MQCDLERIFGELATTVPTDKDESFIFSSQNLPIPPTQLTTDSLYIEKHFQDYAYSHRIDSLMFHAHKEAYRNLALLIFAITFVRQSYVVHVTLTHPASQIKNLIIENAYIALENTHSGLVTRPEAFKYWPEEAGTDNFN